MDILNENIDARDYRVSFDKIQSALGFDPDNSVRDAIPEIADWVKNIGPAFKDDIYYNVNYIFRDR